MWLHVPFSARCLLLCLCLYIVFCTAILYTVYSRDYIRVGHRACDKSANDGPMRVSARIGDAWDFMSDLSLASTPAPNLSLCPLQPPNLVGSLRVTFSPPPTEVIQKLTYGGNYRPSECKARERTAVIIPYRDRRQHLYTILSHLHTVLQRQQLHYGIYVIELELPTQFNRGTLANIGFLTASNIADYTCYVIHDVDLLPLDDRNLYRCGKNPRHMITPNSKFEDSKPANSGHVGGVLAVTPSQFLKINGFSNLYFGWGGEDNDILIRIRFHNMTIERPDQRVGAYLALSHTRDTSNPPNPNRYVLLKEAAGRMEGDGLSSLRYSQRALEFRKTYTWVLVTLL